MEMRAEGMRTGRDFTSADEFWSRLVGVRGGVRHGVHGGVPGGLGPTRSIIRIIILTIMRRLSLSDSHQQYISSGTAKHRNRITGITAGNPRATIHT